MAGSGFWSTLLDWPRRVSLFAPSAAHAALQINGLRSGLETLLELLGGRDLALDDGLELVAGMEGDDVARLDRHRLAGARIAARARAFLADREVAEARQLDLVAGHQRLVQQVEE